ncbi:SET domain-containing protein [Plasmodiophora brassicae]
MGNRAQPKGVHASPLAWRPLLKHITIAAASFAIGFVCHAPPADTVADVVHVNHVAISSSSTAKVLQDLYASYVDPASSRPSGGSDFADIVTWMTSQGASFPNVDIVTYDDEYRGVHAARDIGPGEAIMDIPERFIITGSLAMNAEIGQAARAALPDDYAGLDASHNLIALFLTVERDLGRRSWWFPYLQTLPTSYANLPVNYDADEVAMLAESGNNMDTLHTWELERIVHDYNALCGALASFCDQHTLETYKWARLTVKSRAFSLTIDGVEQTALMPYADMVNHDFDSVASWRFQHDARRGQIYSRQPVPKGAPITITYGAKSNRRLLSSYGFALPDNPFDTATIHVQLPDGEAASGMLAKRVAKSNNPDTEFYRIRFTITPRSDDDAFQRALSLSRVAVATPEELDVLLDGDTPVSLRNERAALRYLAMAMDASYFQTRQSVEVDEALLKVGLTQNQRNVVLTRLGEKRVLLAAMKMLDDLLTVVDPGLDQDEFNRRRLHKDMRPHVRYLAEVADLHRRSAATPA